MRFWVSVPVLSEQIVVTEPRVSTAGSLRIRACRFNIRREPMARAIVTTAGSPSGITATAKLTAVRINTLIVSPRSQPKTKIIATSPREAIANFRPN